MNVFGEHSTVTPGARFLGVQQSATVEQGPATMLHMRCIKTVSVRPGLPINARRCKTSFSMQHESTRLSVERRHPNTLEHTSKRACSCMHAQRCSSIIPVLRLCKHQECCGQGQQEHHGDRLGVGEHVGCRVSKLITWTRWNYRVEDDSTHEKAGQLHHQVPFMLYMGARSQGSSNSKFGMKGVTLQKSCYMGALVIHYSLY